MGEQRGSTPSDAPGPDLGQEREQFIKTFSRGAQLTKQFLEEFDALQSQLEALRQENSRLRSAVEADDAIRDLIRKIETLELERQKLLSRQRQIEEATSDFNDRFREMEHDFANLANLFVATNSLHSSLSPRAVSRRVREVLEQLLGAEQFGVYLSVDDGRGLIPIVVQGFGSEQPSVEELWAGPVGDVARAGVARIDDECDPSQGSVERPPAVFPLQIDDNIVGVVAIFKCFAQKTSFSTVDFELFKLLGQHAAAALMSSGLFAKAERKLPGPEAFGDLFR
jgi:hypothetical protein